jgi:hypothetical protein
LSGTQKRKKKNEVSKTRELALYVPWKSFQTEREGLATMGGKGEVEKMATFFFICIYVIRSSNKHLVEISDIWRAESFLSTLFSTNQVLLL